jgi:hypothetical protein
MTTYSAEPATRDLYADPNTLSGILQVGIKPSTDLAPHGSTIPSLTNPSQSDGDSFYVFSYLSGGGRQFTVLFHLLVLHPLQPDQQQLSLLAISLLDETDVPALYYSAEVPDGSFNKTTVSKEGLNIQVFSSDKRENTIGSLSGDDSRLHVTGSVQGPNGTPAFTIDLNMSAIGPTLPDLANGVIPFPGNSLNFEYALPRMSTTGKLVVNGQLYDVTGESWLDREWGHFGAAKWTWMGVDLGDVLISLWDQGTYEANPTTYVGGQAFATTLNKKTATITLSTVTITEELYADKVNGVPIYPRAWRVAIPGQTPFTVTSLKSVSMDKSALPTNQAVSSTMIPRLEAKCVVSGTTHANATLSGTAFVEVGIIIPLGRPAASSGAGSVLNDEQGVSNDNSRA